LKALVTELTFCKKESHKKSKKKREPKKGEKRNPYGGSPSIRKDAPHKIYS